MIGAIGNVVLLVVGYAASRIYTAVSTPVPAKEKAAVS
jgi:hypothetical protein